MAKNQASNKQALMRKRKTKTIGIVVAVVLVLYIIGLINPFTGNYFKYPYYVLFCGQKPIVTSSIMGKGYYTPDMKSYRIITLGGGLYCTEDEARANGFTKNTSP